MVKNRSAPYISILPYEIFLWVLPPWALPSKMMCIPVPLGEIST